MSFDASNRRKLENKFKYDLGRLIIKADLFYLSPEHNEVLLGGLIYLKTLLNDDHNNFLFDQFKILGLDDFKAKGEHINNNNLKYELGGLVIKSGLDYLSPNNKDVLLGGMIYIKTLIDDDHNNFLFDQFKTLGEEAFKTKGKYFFQITN